MKLSIIIPVYNVDRFLRRCLDSLKIAPERFVNDVEVIIVDDGSTDESGAILDEYAKKNPFYVIHKKNGGCCSARNVGMEIAKGDFIAHLDSDDCLSENAVETMLDAISKHGNSYIIQTNFFMCKGGEKALNRKNAIFDELYTLDSLPPYWVLVWNKLYNRKFIESHNIRFNERMNYDDDAEYNIQCFRYASVIQGYSGTTHEHYYDNDGSITRTLNKDKLLNATVAMTELLRQDNPPIVERIIRERIVRKWTSKEYVKVFGGE